MSFVLPIHATASGGLPNMDPVGSPIARSPKTGRIHQGFQQQGTAPEADLPVARHLPHAQRQNLAGQPFNAYPRQNQKSAIVDDRLQVASPLFVAPADPAISSLHLPGRRGPEQASQLLLAVAHPVTQVRAERHAASEIVIPFHLLAPAAALGCAFHQHQFQSWRRIPRAPVRSKTQRCLLAADPSRPSSADREAPGSLRSEAAPAVVGTRGSSIPHWAVSTPATRRPSARSRSLRGRKTPAQSGASTPVRRCRTYARKR